MDRSSRRAAQYVLAYGRGAADDAVKRGRQPAEIPPELIEYQAERARELAHKLRRRGAVLLDDPVGTGKTVVALTAAALLLDERRVDRVLVVAPNDGVRKLWRTRAGFLWPDLGAGLEFRTIKDLPKRPRGIEERRRTLVVVDEAHRLQNVRTDGYGIVARHAADARVLLVTATPFQLEARGLENMLRIPEHAIPDDQKRGRLPKTVDVGPIRRYASAVAEYLKAEHGAAHETSGCCRRTTDADGSSVKRALEEVTASEADAVAAMSPFFVSPFDRSRAGIEGLYARGIPAPHCIDPGAWARLYQVLRVLPELPRMHDLNEEAKSSDSYQRMILSSHRAVLNHKAFRDFRTWARSPTAPRSARDLLEIVQERLSDGDERAHPKVRETSEWVRDRLKECRHVLVFCVWEGTQSALRDAIEMAAPGFRVEAPVSLEQARFICDRKGFGRPVDDSNPPIAMVVRDNLSESVDMDGGRPCVVHHDLAWNPVRWDQRMGRVIRASSGFAPIDDRDIFIPVLDVAADRRLCETMGKRRDLSGHILRMASLVGDPEEEDGPSL